MYTNLSQENEIIQTVSGNSSYPTGTILPTISETSGLGKIGIGADATTLNIDEELLNFKGVKTPLLDFVLKNAEKIFVDSPEVDVVNIKNKALENSFVITTADCGGNVRAYTRLPLEEKDALFIQRNVTMLARGVDGYDAEGRNLTPGIDLMLVCTGIEATDGNPVVRAINGKKTSPEEEFGQIPKIPKGTKIVILGNTLYETQKVVEEDVSTCIEIEQGDKAFYLQKRGINQIMSNYLERQLKKIPNLNSFLAEQAITLFKKRGNMTFWASIPGKFKILTPVGIQYAYQTKGIRWQIGKQFASYQELTAKKLLAFINIFFQTTYKPAPTKGIFFVGSNLAYIIQSLNIEGLTSKQDENGEMIQVLSTMYGEIEFVVDPSLDDIGWGNSGALIPYNGIRRYVYESESSFIDKVESQEAIRSGILIWDGVILKNPKMAMWLDGENTNNNNIIKFWDKDTAPESSTITDGMTIYLIVDCPGINTLAKAGQIWRANGTGSSASWTQVEDAL